jgi:acyl carrier protein
MSESQSRIKAMVMGEIRDRLPLLSLTESDVGNDFDLVQSGLLDSLMFVDLLSSLEERLGYEIRINETRVDRVTTISGLADVIEESARPRAE